MERIQEEEEGSGATMKPMVFMRSEGGISVRRRTNL